MQKSPLGRSNLKVSRYGLGTMTWGGPTPMDIAHGQIDRALAHGINLIDTAEIYPAAPPRAETVGRSERIIGLWFEKNSRRSDVILATQHSGIGQNLVRHGAPIGPETIRDGVEGALRRLRTDYIDLFQFHWPNRDTYHKRGAEPAVAHRPDPAAIVQTMADSLGALAVEQRRGTIRHFGLSNETVWGMAQWLRLAEAGAGPRPVSVQNEYSLLCRQHEFDMAELCRNEDLGLLAYAPLAVGLLTGKYQGRKRLAMARIALMPDLGGRRTPCAELAVDAYLDIAFKHDLDIVGMALAWVAGRPTTASVVFGATDLAQLDRILSQTDLRLSDAALADIEIASRAHPMPF
ncbi:aldo/keto reductase [Pseudooceanicola sp.]|uniref:aldo/keto reductase n=1 Tax=Pseudooceanicola sp. TaxID=1914328 RepID=UPI0026167ADC|nr:aldo/keto reductase [Pseudooceanicola sp.]MDF1854835.1 aldo/keto reductase [Pseudooceanicola sp.]